MSALVDALNCQTSTKDCSDRILIGSSVETIIQTCLSNFPYIWVSITTPQLIVDILMPDHASSSLPNS